MPFRLFSPLRTRSSSEGTLAGLQGAVGVPRLAGIGLVIGGLALIIAGRGQDGPRGSLARRRGVLLVFLAAASWALSATIMKPALLQVPVLAGTALRIPMAGLVLWLTPWTRGTIDAIRRSTSTSAPLDSPARTMLM